MKTILYFVWSCVLLSVAGSVTAADSCVVRKMEIERLPDLTIPRAGHAVFCAGGEWVVAGGHTNGFVPTPTAEYFKDGKWHTMQMMYNHDFGFSVVMKNGKVLLGGGCNEPIGIGQTFLAEIYDPATHSFEGFSSMEKKRTNASGLELDSGRVVIAGNWYHKDAIEIFDGKNRFTYVKDVSEERSTPTIFRISDDDALIIGNYDTKGDILASVVADRLKGDTLHIPLLAEWHPLLFMRHRDDETFIGDESKGQYTYLLPVCNKNGQVSIMKVENGVFSLLPTDGPVPMRSQWEDIFYTSAIVVDRKAGRGYLYGLSHNFQAEPNTPHRHYVLAIDYARASQGRGAPLTLYYTDSLSYYPEHSPVLTEDGNLLFAGGLYSGRNGNFAPSSEVWVFHVGTPIGAKAGGISAWWWALLAVLLSLACALLIIYIRKEKHPQECQIAETESTNNNNELLERIRELMVSRKLYTNNKLKVSDVAALLTTNSRYVSDCINSSEGCTFIQFVNRYRVEHAKRLMRDNPEIKNITVCLESGFSNLQSFIRIFKQATGQTPSEWKSNL
ncbi:MAG: helix-turn-helix domain-containing protein [Prevotella sp.]|nr:helix-turn-helix domain-containing protein [Prevotella sp.]